MQPHRGREPVTVTLPYPTAFFQILRLFASASPGGQARLTVTQDGCIRPGLDHSNGMPYEISQAEGGPPALKALAVPTWPFLGTTLCRSRVYLLFMFCLSSRQTCSVKVSQECIRCGARDLHVTG